MKEVMVIVDLDAKERGVHFGFSNFAVRLKTVVMTSEKIHSKELKYTCHLMRIFKDLITIYAINSWKDVSYHFSYDSTPILFCIIQIQSL